MKRTLALVLLPASLAACVVYVPSSRMLGQVDEAAAQVERNRARVKEDLAAKSAVFGELAVRTATPDAAPYPRAKRLLRRMAEAAAGVDSEADAIGALRDDTAALARGKERISTQDPEFAQAKRLRRDMKAGISRLESKLKAYSALSKELEGLIAEHNVARMDMAEFKPRVDKALEEFDQRTALVGARLETERRRIEQRPPAGREEAREKLADLDRILSGMKAERKRFELKADRFRQEVGSGSLLWVGPGMASATIYGDLKASADKIDALAAEFQSAARRLNEISLSGETRP